MLEERLFQPGAKVLPIRALRGLLNFWTFDLLIPCVGPCLKLLLTPRDLIGSAKRFSLRFAVIARHSEDLVHGHLPARIIKCGSLLRDRGPTSGAAGRPAARGGRVGATRSFENLSNLRAMTSARPRRASVVGQELVGKCPAQN